MRLTQEQAVVVAGKIKVTLQELQGVSPGLVRIDWLRFTVAVDAVAQADPLAPLDVDALALMDRRGRDVVRMGRGVDVDMLKNAAQVARAGAVHLVRLLGCLEVGPTDDRGMDFYSVRTALMHAGEVVGYVLAGGRSSRQASTVHFNLFGSAWLHIPTLAMDRLSAWLDDARGTITRADLALDVWQGLPVTDARDAYIAGQFDVRGKRPSQREHGSWTSGHSRTFEIGSRETGKMLRVYEKGHQLFGPDSADPWVRLEVEYRNNQRLIPTDVLRRPQDFFAGAYPWCAEILARTRSEFESHVIKTERTNVHDVTAEAAVTRVIKWIKGTAAPSIYAFMQHAGDEFVELLCAEGWRVPGRLRGFDQSAISAAFSRVAASFAPLAAPSTSGA